MCSPGASALACGAVFFARRSCQPIGGCSALGDRSRGASLRRSMGNRQLDETPFVSLTRHADRCYLLVQTSAPDYRRPVINELARVLGPRFHLLVGAESFHETIQTDPEIVRRFGTVETRYLAGRRFVWQRLPLASVLKAPVVIAELNPRVLSNWLVLALRGILRRPTVLWGHAWPARGANAPTEYLRHLQRNLASVIVVYTEAQRDALARKMPNKTIIAAPNALYRRSDMRPANRSSRPTDILYVGRLVHQKKPLLLLQGYLLALDELPIDVRLTFVGAGPELTDLQRAASRAEGRVSFLGHISDSQRLRDIYAGAIASASPGYVGLSITQSIGFGVPMLIADDEPHSPEIEAACDGINARFFRADDPESVADALIQMVRERDVWASRRVHISELARAQYSLEVMVSRLVEAIAAADSLAIDCGVEL